MHPRVARHRSAVERSLTELAGAVGDWARAAAAAGDGRPLAAVVDIDEVLLCGVCRARGAPWDEQLRRPLPAYPGARALMVALRRAGVLPVLVTGRREWRRDLTVANLRAERLITAAEARAMGVKGNVSPGRARGGAPKPPRLVMRQCAELALQCPAPGPWKMRARRRLAETHRILLNVGDQESDFVRDPERLRADALHEWRVPNPFYVVE